MNQSKELPNAEEVSKARTEAVKDLHGKEKENSERIITKQTPQMKRNIEQLAESGIG